MPIKNTSKKENIGGNFLLCNDVFSKFKGLMFSKKQNKALIFKFNYEKIVPLHMVFVFYPIDVLFLDKNKIVVDLKENFRPFTFYTPKKKAMYVVEMPKNSIKKLKAEAGDKIKF